MGILEKISSTAYDKIIKRYPAFAQVDNTKARQPVLKETAPLAHFMNTYFKWMTDQDNVLRYKAKGKGRQFYDNMVDDDAHISACINIRSWRLLVRAGRYFLSLSAVNQSLQTGRLNVLTL